MKDITNLANFQYDNYKDDLNIKKYKKENATYIINNEKYIGKRNSRRKKSQL